jgi:hypothetical protein
MTKNAKTDPKNLPPLDKPAPPAPKVEKKPVRDAGRGAMKTPPKKWDDVDEQADESFPASDPPGNY